MNIKVLIYSFSFYKTFSGSKKICYIFYTNEKINYVGLVNVGFTKCTI